MKKWLILTLSIIIFFGGLIILSQSAKQDQKINAGEQQLIESWIKKNNLNEYGDPNDTVYIGGTPLFDEATGKKIDKYEYILRSHPDHPWRKK